jgi:hypothetical protein
VTVCWRVITIVVVGSIGTETEVLDGNEMGMMRSGPSWVDLAGVVNDAGAT